MIETKLTRIKIKLNKQFYDITAVRESLKDFKGACTGKIANKKSIEIILKPKDKPINALGHEFCNYVLGLMKNKTLV